VEDQDQGGGVGGARRGAERCDKFTCKVCMDKDLRVEGAGWLCAVAVGAVGGLRCMAG
jgi:hypothetical protein